MDAIIVSGSGCGQTAPFYRLSVYINKLVNISPPFLVKWNAFPAYFKTLMRKVSYDTWTSK